VSARLHATRAHRPTRDQESTLSCIAFFLVPKSYCRRSRSRIHRPKHVAKSSSNRCFCRALVSAHSSDDAQFAGIGLRAAQTTTEVAKMYSLSRLESSL